MYLCGNIYLYSDGALLGFLGSATDAGVYRPAANLAASFYQAACFLPLLLYPKLLDWAKTPNLLFKRQLQIAGVVLVMGSLGIAGVGMFSRELFQWMYGALFASASGPFVVLLVARGITVLNSIFSWGLIASDRDRVVGLTFLAGALVMGSVTVVLVRPLGIWAPAIGGLAADLTICVATLVICWQSRFPRRV
jgi:O-antigen/teichoic acid export membrane protein